MNIIQIYFISYLFYYLKAIKYFILHLIIHYMINRNYLVNFNYHINHMAKIFQINSQIIINFNRNPLIINLNPKI